MGFRFDPVVDRALLPNLVVKKLTVVVRDGSAGRIADGGCARRRRRACCAPPRPVVRRACAPVVFASFVFVCWFLPCFFAVWGVLPPSWRNAWITFGSLCFYGWWRPQYVLLMLVSVAIDYGAARAMGPRDSGHRRKRWLVLSLVANLGMLAWFKYANLAVATWNDATPWPVAWEEVLLPVGISFFTFQSMSYTIDVYRGEVAPVRSFADLLCFVSLFPQLVAGPIVRYRDVERELHERRTTFVAATDGALLFCLGFAKKVMLADRIAPLADAVFASPDVGFVDAWLGALAYALQIYFDFSGYSDMAIGLGLVLGFRFPANFRSPYRATSVTEFWRRWHTSLSTWLRDYLYVPLGGNRGSAWATYRNLVLTMLLGGLWHGAQWTFVLWGAWQGAWLVVERLRGRSAPWGFLPVPAQVLATFAVTVFGWVLFRADGVGRIASTWAAMLGGSGLGAVPDLGAKGAPCAIAFGAGLVVAFAFPRSEDVVARFHPLAALGGLLLFVAALGQVLASDHVPFLYFRF